MIELRIGRPWIETNPNGCFYLLYDVGARLRVLSDGLVLFEEEDYPIVELAVQLRDWLDQPATNRQDFISRSIETDEEGWITIVRAPGGWLVSGIDNDSPPGTQPEEEIELAIREFLRDVAEQVGPLTDEDLTFLVTDKAC
jgi:hypothetical protein